MKQNVQALHKIFEDYLIQQQPHGTPDTLYEPVRYMNDIGGKRIRPLLVLLAYQLWHQDITPSLSAAIAVEYFHNFSLMHDDIMDEAPLRRGHESVYHKFGRNAAILSGDAMLISSFQLLLQAGNLSQSGSELIALLSQTAMQICEGQQLDMDFEIRETITEAEYIEMIRCKTACLIGFSLQVGALLAGACEEESDAIYKYGENLGLAFQIQDDYLDVFGDISLTGKQEGGDILRGKKNFLYVHTLNKLSPDRQIEFIQLYKQAGVNNDPTTIIKFYQQYKVDDYVRDIESGYSMKAMTEVAKISSVDTEPIKSIASALINRHF
ncbi:MAG: polyprenyl synthetase family protein [Bacteroidota bacterium]|nr:polyprenyl synthetase family protein [Bacteroidota bacterium]